MGGFQKYKSYFYTSIFSFNTKATLPPSTATYFTSCVTKKYFHIGLFSYYLLTLIAYYTHK